MKKNYQIELDKIIASLGNSRPTLFLHSCCGPCSSYVIEYLSQYFDITVYYYNPNIFPLEEYERRLSTQIELVEKLGGAVMTESDYNPDSFYNAAKGLEAEREHGLRCTECFKLRLESTAKRAKEGQFDFFATTLTVSPHKNAELINEICNELAEKYGVRALPSDFKKREGYKRSIELSNEFDLYRQDYCGCEFSLKQRMEQKAGANLN